MLRDYVVEQRVVLEKVRIAALLDRALQPGTHAAARVVGVSGIQRIDDLHAFHDQTEGREALRIVARVVGEIDVDLRLPVVGSAHRKAERAARVAAHDGIIGDRDILPRGGHARIRVQPPLRDVSFEHAGEARTVVVTVADQVVEAVGAVRRQCALDFDYEHALVRVEAGAVRVGRLHGPAGIRRVEQQRRSVVRIRCGIRGNRGGLTGGGRIRGFRHIPGTAGHHRDQSEEHDPPAHRLPSAVILVAMFHSGGSTFSRWRTKKSLRFRAP
jgi:hypothetical protein